MAWRKSKAIRKAWIKDGRPFYIGWGVVARRGPVWTLEGKEHIEINKIFTELEGKQMTLPPLEELKQLQQQATPGPWRCDGAGFITACDHEDDDLATRVIDINRYWENQDCNRPVDFQLAALAPALLAEVIRMRARAADARDMARQLSENPTIMTTEQHLFADIADELDETLGEHQ